MEYSVGHFDGNWIPILSDPVRAKALEAIARIELAVSATTGKEVPSRLCELGLFRAYRMLSGEVGISINDIEEPLGLAAENLAGLDGIGVFDGLCSLGWTFAHISNLFRKTEFAQDLNEDPLIDIDEFVLNLLRQGGAELRFDLYSGLVGIGVYLIERLPRVAAYEGLGLVLDQLASRAIRIWGGLTWSTKYTLSGKTSSHSSDETIYDLGVAKGVAGVIAFVTRVVGLGVGAAVSEKMLSEATRWLLARERPPQKITRFSHVFRPGSEPLDSRVAWCYGDLGIGATLYSSAVLLQDEARRRYSLELIGKVASRLDSIEIADQGVCHGVFGIAHIYNRMYQFERNPAFLAVSEKMFDSGLSRFILPCAKYPGFENPDTTLVSDNVDTSLLNGLVGIALVLMAGVSTVAPLWDRRLFLSH